MPKGHFGSLVIGEEAFQQEQAEVAQGKDVFGALVLGDDPSATAGPKVKEPAAIEAPANLKAFEAALLAADQDGADALLKAEFAREEGPRKTALKMLRAAETAREGGGRTAILDQIDAGLDKTG